MKAYSDSLSSTSAISKPRKPSSLPLTTHTLFMAPNPNPNPTPNPNINDLFTSLISDIKSYSGKDPLLPWLRGIKRMKECLPPHILKEKLPRFLQKCTQTFESDRRYRDDLRYIRVWLHLMDYVEDPKILLRTMEMNQIGTKRSLFYQAYALYYEKIKKFEEAEKMYHLGVQNLAEPVELQKSYEKFLQRMERHKNKKTQCEGMAAMRHQSVGTLPLHSHDAEENNINIRRVKGTLRGKSLCADKGKSRKILEEKYLNEMPPRDLSNNKHSLQSHDVGLGVNILIKKELNGTMVPQDLSKQGPTKVEHSFKSGVPVGNDTIVANFVDTAAVGNPETEDACHHGLVEPTINMKEAMNAINSMFREPIETVHIAGRSITSREKERPVSASGFKVFVDEGLDEGIEHTGNQMSEKVMETSVQQRLAKTSQAEQKGFEIFVDEENDESYNGRDNMFLEQDHLQQMMECSESSSSDVNAFVFPCPQDVPSDSPDERTVGKFSRRKLREDTVIRRFVGFATSDEPAVENVCHHGLVDPTINLKEAMDDINNMFGKPIDFVRKKRSRKPDRSPEERRGLNGFLILPDDEEVAKQEQAPSNLSNKSFQKEENFAQFSILPDDDNEGVKDSEVQLPPQASSKSREHDLFEPTVFTKAAMDDINKMFGMPLDL